MRMNVREEERYLSEELSGASRESESRGLRVENNCVSLDENVNEIRDEIENVPVDDRCESLIRIREWSRESLM
eukprot:GABW01004696.1.p2 GENE.GABW01004696.1~~GABW01004696.1.p2  ORF type:complete len:73 (-),score=20.22 GABW01004696.1:123-341(-)